ncbi:uncharacterized protein LOC143367185 [Andrena cerasifolii]|uniref:uncharacterized protein LOC143367185 n=1 Tax=Andrena cerasifolii TaxID=2819439 RepID=UPI004037E56D
MHLHAMPNSHGLTLFIWILSILTLSIGDEIKTDRTTPTTSAPSTNITKAFAESDHPASSSIIQPLSESVHSAKISNTNVVTSSFAGEGGPISIAPTAQHVSSTASHLETIADNLNIEDNLLKENDDTQNAARRINTVSKIVPRKGANQALDVKKESSDYVETKSSNDSKSLVKSPVIVNGSHDDKEHITVDSGNSKLNANDERIKDGVTAVNNSSPHLSISRQNVSTSTTVVTSTIKEHKAKPTVTIAGPNSDKRPFISSIRSHLGMPKKIDYVLPVIITVTALPVLGAIIFMVYKQGRDCWDKRHYRRMDFLIDGMYND